MSEVALPRTLVNQILAHSQHHPEEEVCGLIGARDGVVTHLYPVANVSAEPGHLFAMDPHGQIEAMRRMREAGEALFAIYHSHPHAGARPSRLDREQAAYPEALHLIVSLDTRGVLEMRGFYLRAGGEEAVELALE